MNKKYIEGKLDIAYQALKTYKIANEENKIEKTFRGQISTFGAAITMGSLLPAIAFFSNRGGSSVDRVKMVKAIYHIVTGEKANKETDLYNYAKEQKKASLENYRSCKEDILNASIALKLAMNMYTLVDEKNNKKDNDGESEEV